jgi:hypothetical protein
MEIIVPDVPQRRTYSETAPDPGPAATVEARAAYEAAKARAWTVSYEVAPADAVRLFKAFKRAGIEGDVTVGPIENFAASVAIGEECVTKILSLEQAGGPVTFRRMSDGVALDATAPAAIPLALIVNRRFARAAGDEAYQLMVELDRQRGNSQPASV